MPRKFGATFNLDGGLSALRQITETLSAEHDFDVEYKYTITGIGRAMEEELFVDVNIDTKDADYDTDDMKDLLRELTQDLSISMWIIE